MARMLAKVSPLQCVVCRAPLGPDCAPAGQEKRAQKARERREVRRMMDEQRWLLPELKHGDSPSHLCAKPPRSR